MNWGFEKEKIKYIDKQKLIFKAFDKTWYVHPLHGLSASNNDGEIIMVSNNNMQNCSFQYKDKTWFIANNPNYKLFAYDKNGQIFLLFNHNIFKLGQYSDIEKYLCNIDKKIYVNDYHCSNLHLLLKHGDLSEYDKNIVSQLIKTRMKKVMENNFS